MSKIDFKLQPFKVDPHGTRILIEGSVRRDDGALHLEYRLQGRLETLAIPPMALQPQRRHELWKETCFECFIQPAGTTTYWELNLSPAGHWNLYRFDGYRQDMREAPLVNDLSVSVRKMEGGLALSTEVDLDALRAGPGPLKIGLNAVLCTPVGRMGYWALTHPGAKPDFHHPGSFLLTL